MAVATGAVAVTVAQQPAQAATVKRVLFDDTKAEEAGNADWIISTSKPDPLAQNANPTSETSWTGALSAWGVALQKTGGYSLKTLASPNTITYGGTGALDLKNFDEFVIPEPNILFTAAEKTAIMKFVQAGGGLFLIVDHSGSDRNNDGEDSVEVATDLMSNNTVDSTDPFGFSIDTNDISSENAVAITNSTDPVLNGSFGKVTGAIIRDGSTQTLKAADNSSVKGLVYRPSYSGTTGAFFTTSTFGSGRVAVWGDSSPVDDGTGQSGNTLYNGWDDTAGTDSELALNATAWLAGTGTTSPTTAPTTAPTTTPPTGGTCGSQLLANTGFESGATSWTASSGVISSSTSEPAHAGSYKAWLDGYGTTHTDTLSQTVTIPSGCSGATLSFWMYIDTDETGSTAYDKLTVSAAGTTLATYSNVDAAGGYVQKTLTVSGTGSKKILFTGVEGTQLATAFVLDDVTLTPYA
jgi:hypothetical protein